MNHQITKKISVWTLIAVLTVGVLCLPAAAAERQPGDVPCPSCGSYNLTERIDEPTCVRSGGCRWICQDCGLEMTMVGTSYWNSLNKAALGHDYEDGTCTRCGARDLGYVEPSRSGSQEPEQPGSDGPGTPAESGTAAGGSSGSNAEQPSGSTGEETEETCSHIWDDRHTASTCTTRGRTYRVCRICGLEETVSTDPLAEHDYQLTETVPATTEASGRKTYTCTVCGGSYEETIPQLTGGTAGTTACVNHKWSYSSQRATCTEKGQYIRTCTVCGKSEVYSTTPASGHRYTSAVTRAATVEREGVKTYTCSVCGDTYTESIPRIPEAAVAAKTGFRHSGSASLKKLSQAEITQLLDSAPLTISDDPFDTEPNTAAPYAPGKVSASALQAAVDRLNALRRIAGLPAVQLDSSLCENAQYGAVLLAASNFSHYPTQPGDMSDSFFKQALSATSSSNISGGRNLPGAVDGFMDDSDSSNIDRLGHRRWQLNPSMGKVGFGYAQSASSTYGRYVTEKVFDQSGNGCDYDFIGWPASGYFPNQLFDSDTAWSVTLDPKQYDTSGLSGVTVTLTREEDGKTWTFSSGRSDGYFNVNLTGYGVSNCIIFRPSSISSYDGTYTVRIDGLKAKNGQAVSDFTYQVDFFGEESGSQTADASAQNPERTAQTANTTTVSTQNASSGGTSTFRDVAATHWASAAIRSAVEKGIVNGYQDGTFRPAATVTSAHFNAMLSRAFFPSDLKSAKTDANWWTPNVLTNQSHGILKGTELEAQYQSTGTYGSKLNTGISRYDMAQMMYNILKDRGAALPTAAERSAAQSAMKDWASVPAGYREAVTTCYALGLLNGQNDGSFGGQNSMNRAQGCTVISRLAEYLEKSGV